MNKIAIATLTALMFATAAQVTAARADDDQTWSEWSSELVEDGADFIEDAGQGTQVQPWTDAVSDEIRDLNSDDEPGGATAI